MTDLLTSRRDHVGLRRGLLRRSPHLRRHRSQILRRGVQLVRALRDPARDRPGQQPGADGDQHGQEPRRGQRQRAPAVGIAQRGEVPLLCIVLDDVDQVVGGAGSHTPRIDGRNVGGTRRVEVTCGEQRVRVRPRGLGERERPDEVVVGHALGIVQRLTAELVERGERRHLHLTERLEGGGPDGEVVAVDGARELAIEIPEEDRDRQRLLHESQTAVVHVDEVRLDRRQPLQQVEREQDEGHQDAGEAAEQRVTEGEAGQHGWPPVRSGSHGRPHGRSSSIEPSSGVVGSPPGGERERAAMAFCRAAVSAPRARTTRGRHPEVTATWCGGVGRVQLAWGRRTT